MLFAAVASAFCLASCSKSEIGNSEDFVLNIKVADLNVSDTKAVKTGWTSGDRINIWYDTNISDNPDLVIKYDGTKWIKDETVTLSGKSPATSGNIKFFYEGNNDLSKYEINHIATVSYRGTANLLFCEDYYHPTSYAYSGGVLSFEISNWVPLSEVQVVITGIDPEDYQLKCDKLQMYSEIVLLPEETGTTNVGYNEYTDGVANKDGAAFYFRNTNTDGDPSDYTFTLINKDSAFEYTYTAKGKTHKDGTFTAITIPASSFGIYL